MNAPAGHRRIEIAAIVACGALPCGPEPGSQPPRTGPLVASGRRAEAEAIAANTNNPAAELLIYGGLGDKDRALDALERLIDRNAWRAATWMLRPEVAIIRADPRFAELRKRLRITK